MLVAVNVRTVITVITVIIPHPAVMVMVKKVPMAAKIG